MSCIGKIGEGGETCNLKQVEWKIEKFSGLSTGIGKCYRNDYFSFMDSEWCLRIFPGGKNKNSENYLSLFLRAGKHFDFKCNIHFTFGLKKADGCLENTHSELNYTFSKAGEDFGYNMFFHRLELLKRRSDFLPSDVLTVVCTMRQSDLVKVTPGPSRVELREIEKLSKDLQDLLTLKKCCDVTLKVNGKAFEVHKAVLMARSPVFSAMFENEMSEKETGTVVIPDCDDQSFDLFLEYLYSGIINEISFCNAIHLYPTVYKYDVPQLKSFCLQYLAKNLTVEDAVDAVILADKYDETQLMSAVQEFFNVNLSEIVLTEKWESLMKNNYRLANKLIIAMSSKVTIRHETLDSDKNIASSDKVTNFSDDNNSNSDSSDENNSNSDSSDENNSNSDSS